jgi:myo-inositol-1(or 4)-monophosphatase
VQDLDELLELATGAARRAGSLLLEHARAAATGVATKSSATDMVSDADRASERLLRDLLGSTRPHDAILGEEGGESAGSGLLWVVDPLDGTTNYLYRYPVWSVSIACRGAGGWLVGAVHDPLRDETFAAARGRGATCNGRPIAVSRQDRLADALIATGFAYDPGERARQAGVLAQLLGDVRDVRRGGSAALDLAWLAAGRLDGFYEAPLELWDRAAGTLLVREAGGKVTPLRPLGLSGEGVVAAAPALHPRLCDRLAAAAAASQPPHLG